MGDTQQVISLRTAVAAIGLLLAMLTVNAVSQAKRWTLPVADGGGTEPSPPSVHGYLLGTEKQKLTLRADSHGASEGEKVTVELTAKTQFFTAYGGPYSPGELRSGQYVWVWYITADPAKAGTPPHAAVVMLWSKDPSDKPTAQVRRSYDKQL